MNLDPTLVEPQREKTCLFHNADNKDVDPPVHLCSLISAFAIHCLGSYIPVVAIFKIPRPYLNVIAEQVGLSPTWSHTPKAGFIMMWLNCFFFRWPWQWQRNPM